MPLSGVRCGHEALDRDALVGELLLEFGADVICVPLAIMEVTRYLAEGPATVREFTH